jgi:hypothetical protein
MGEFGEEADQMQKVCQRTSMQLPLPMIEGVMTRAVIEQARLFLG